PRLLQPELEARDDRARGPGHLRRPHGLSPRAPVPAIGARRRWGAGAAADSCRRRRRGAGAAAIRARRTLGRRGCAPAASQGAANPGRAGWRTRYPARSLRPITMNASPPTVASSLADASPAAVAPVRPAVFSRLTLASRSRTLW